MDSEAKIIIAFLFNRSGKITLKASELYLPLSMELGWFSTSEAQAFVSFAVTQGLLVEQKGMLHPGFPVEAVTVPVGFTPMRKTYPIVKEKSARDSITDDVATLVAEYASKTKTEVLEEIARIASEKNIIPEVAALLIARTHGLSVDHWNEQVEALFFKGNTT